LTEHKLFRSLQSGIDALVLACGWWMIGLSVFTCVEMVGRKLFRFSLQGVDEIGGYTLAVASALGFAYTLAKRGHTRIDFMVSRLPMTGRALLNCLAMVTLAALAIFATYRGWFVLSESIEFKSHATTPLQTPLWIPQSLWFLGYAMFAILASALAAHCCTLFFTRRDDIDRLYGPPTLKEEIESETGGLKA